MKPSLVQALKEGRVKKAESDQRKAQAAARAEALAVARAHAHAVAAAQAQAAAQAAGQIHIVKALLASYGVVITSPGW